MTTNALHSVIRASAAAHAARLAYGAIARPRPTPQPDVSGHRRCDGGSMDTSLSIVVQAHPHVI